MRESKCDRYAQILSINTFLCLMIFFLIIKLVSTFFIFFFFQAEDGIRDTSVTGVQTCALPIWRGPRGHGPRTRPGVRPGADRSGARDSRGILGWRVVCAGAGPGQRRAVPP